MSLPSFPSGINTELRDKKPIPFKRPKPKRPRDPRRIFLLLFILLMVIVAIYPALRDWLR